MQSVGGGAPKKRFSALKNVFHRSDNRKEQGSSFGMKTPPQAQGQFQNFVPGQQPFKPTQGQMQAQGQSPQGQQLQGQFQGRPQGPIQGQFQGQQLQGQYPGQFQGQPQQQPGQAQVQPQAQGQFQGQIRPQGQFQGQFQGQPPQGGQGAQGRQGPNQSPHQFPSQSSPPPGPSPSNELGPRPGQPIQSSSSFNGPVSHGQEQPVTGLRQPGYGLPQQQQQQQGTFGDQGARKVSGGGMLGFLKNKMDPKNKDAPTSGPQYMAYGHQPLPGHMQQQAAFAPGQGQQQTQHGMRAPLGPDGSSLTSSGQHEPHPGQLVLPSQLMRTATQSSQGQSSASESQPTGGGRQPPGNLSPVQESHDQSPVQKLPPLPQHSQLSFHKDQTEQLSTPDRQLSSTPFLQRADDEAAAAAAA
ncbi:hypothetical protein QBC42DRAFT_274516, partial [Cladorrhinum samala]